MIYLHYYFIIFMANILINQPSFENAIYSKMVIDNFNSINRNRFKYRMSQRQQSNLEDYPIPFIKLNKSKFSAKQPSPSDDDQNNILANLACQKNNQFSQKYWGRVKPYWFDQSTNIPKIIIPPNFIISLLLNLLIIFTICVALPISANRNIANIALTPSGNNRLLSEITVSSIQLSAISPKYVARKYSIYIYSAIWAAYQLVFLVILLLGNPGYGDSIESKQLSIQQKNYILNNPKIKNIQGYNKCSICNSIVDNSVYHCQECDICCEGFSHHCEWVGKCIGYRNQIFLKAYSYGYMVGILILIGMIICLSIPS